MLSSTKEFGDWRFLGKTYRYDDSNLPKQMLGAWVHSSIAPRRACHPQQSCHNNAIKTIQDVLQVTDSHGVFKSWVPLARDEMIWDQKFNEYFCKFQATK
jgi:hypothetical protein